jgi:flagella basal body P-ring formation protein FlgA
MRFALLLLVLPSVLQASTPAVAADSADPRMAAAIVESVRQRVGAGSDVIVESLEIFIPSGVGDDARVSASPDPAARAGGPIRFTVSVDGVRSGHAEARLHIIAEQARLVRDVPRGATIAAADVEAVREEIAEGALRPRLRAAELVGSRALRDLAAGRLVPATAVVVPPTVRTGQTVTAVSRVAGIEAAATMVAAESGGAGAVIRVVNRATRKALRARIVSAEVVEIIHD